MSRPPRCARGSRTFAAATLLVVLGCDTGGPADRAYGGVPVDTLDRARTDTASFESAHRERLTIARRLGPPDRLGRVIDLEVVGRFLILSDELMPPHLKVLDPEAGSIVDEFGQDGEGPGEIRVPFGLTQVAGSRAGIEAFGLLNQRLYRWEIKPGSGSATLVNEVPFRGETPGLGPIRAGDVYLAHGPYDRAYSIEVLDTLGTPLRRLYLEKPFAAFAGPEWAVRGLDNFYVARHPATERFALAYNSASRIDILSGLEGPYRSIEGPRPVRVEFHVEGDPPGRVFDVWERAYAALATTRHRVYALFRGYSMLGMTEEELRLPELVHVFTWDGDFLGEIALDRGVHAIEVSPDDRKLWGAIEDPLPRIGEWQLPAWVSDEGP